jgi:D-alanyl-lipoteichoic acid acyltransferase DltB (MBOAT superfamily)
MITFVICGVWHGSQMHYIVWGVYHGIWNIVTFQIRRKNVNFTVGHKNMKRITDIGKCIMTFLIVTFGWILFRADSIENAFIYTKHMFHGFTINYNAIVQSILPFTGDNSCLAYFICVAVMIGILYIYECFEEQKKKQDSLVWSGIFLLCILLFGTVGGSSFLYANY